MKWTFYTLTMKTYNNKTLYLKSGIGNGCEWTFNKQEAIWFETDKEAIEFAKQYFKNFDKYQVEGLEEVI